MRDLELYEWFGKVLAVLRCMSLSAFVSFETSCAAKLSAATSVQASRLVIEFVETVRTENHRKCSSHLSHTAYCHTFKSLIQEATRAKSASCSTSHRSVHHS
jgi:hypothetical protein